MLPPISRCSTWFGWNWAASGQSCVLRQVLEHRQHTQLGASPLAFRFATGCRTPSTDVCATPGLLEMNSLEYGVSSSLPTPAGGMRADGTTARVPHSYRRVEGIPHAECHNEYDWTGTVITVFSSLDSCCHIQDSINRGSFVLNPYYLGERSPAVWSMSNILRGDRMRGDRYHAFPLLTSTHFAQLSRGDERYLLVYSMIIILLITIMTFIIIIIIYY